MKNWYEEKKTKRQKNIYMYKSRQDEAPSNSPRLASRHTTQLYIACNFARGIYTLARAIARGSLESVSTWECGCTWGPCWTMERVCSPSSYSRGWRCLVSIYTIYYIWGTPRKIDQAETLAIFFPSSML